MSSTLLNLVSAGAVTSVGFNLAATSAAIRAGVDNFQETQFLYQVSEPIVGARIFQSDNHDVISGGIEQQLNWVLLALSECFSHENAKSANYVRIIPLTIEEIRPNLNKRQALLDGIGLSADKLLKDRLESVQDPIMMGNMSCIHGLQMAEEFLHKHPEGAVCLLAIDSWLNLASIQYGLNENRLLSSATADGLIPGEAVATILLSRTTPNTPYLQIAGLGLAEEESSFISEKPSFGKGLAKAIKKALDQAKLPAHNMHMRLNDLNGEDYFFNEAAYTWARVLRKPMPEGYQHIQIASKVGDIGAAFGPLLLGYNLHLTRTHRLPGQHTLIHLSSTESLRGALVTCAHQYKE